MRRIHLIGLGVFAAVLAWAAYAGSRADNPPQAGTSKPAASAPAKGNQPPPPAIRIKRAPENEQTPRGATTRPTLTPLGQKAAGSQPASQPSGISVVTTQLSPAARAFEKIKGLAGTWEMQDPPLATTDGVTDFKTVFRVISAGKTVIETDFPGSRRENITVYHLDGDAIMLTHYCPLGSQPRMRVERFDQPQQLSFIFHDATNLDVSKDRHCHNLSLTFTDDDNFQQDWTFFQAGEQRHIKSWNWKRVKDDQTGK